MFEAIERGDYLEWELGFQIVEEQDEFRFGFDLLDPTKLIPEEEVPVRRVGKMTLNRNPDNYFAETEQVAFHLGHVVPGIDFTNDPLLQGRLFSYTDTQLRRVGPNFAELPINRPLVPVHNNQRDAMARTTIDKGRVAYFPNSLGKGCPMHAPQAADAFRSYAEKVDGTKIRVRSESFSDHFSQATMFWHSMSDWEKRHIVEAFSFELNQVENNDVRERVMNELLVNVAPDFAEAISMQTGITIAPHGKGGTPTPSAPTPSTPPSKELAEKRSPALSMDVPCKDIRGRKIAILAGEGLAAAQLAALQQTLDQEEALGEVIAARAGSVIADDGSKVRVNRAGPNAPSVIYDGVVVLGGSAEALVRSGIVLHFINEAFRHGKPLAFLGDGAKVLKAAPLPKADEADGVIVGEGEAAINAFVEAMKQHRFPLRRIETVPA
jgi:catalase